MRLNPILFTAFIGIASVGQAAITATWVRDDPSPAAIADDPVLATMQSYLLKVTHTSGDWSLAGVQVQLTGGNFYNHPVFGSATQPHPGIVAIAPALAYDTYVTSPTDDGTNAATQVLGGFPTGLANVGTPVGNLFSASWGDLVTAPSGTYIIARLTFPLALDTLAEVNVIEHGDLPPPDDDEGSWTAQNNPFDFYHIGEIIPEPSALSLLALTGLMALRRRV